MAGADEGNPHGVLFHQERAISAVDNTPLAPVTTPAGTATGYQQAPGGGRIASKAKPVPRRCRGKEIKKRPPLGGLLEFVART